MKKKKFRVTRVYAEEAYIYATSEEVVKELLEYGVPVAWKPLPEAYELEIEEVEEDADN